MSSRIHNITHRIATFAFAAGVTLLLPSLAQAEQERFNVIESGMSSVAFTSDALLETITGTAAVVRGHVVTDRANPGNTTAVVTVPVEALRTGVDLRDEHLRDERWLDAASHPEIRLEVQSVSVPDGATLQHGQTIEARIGGTFHLHGQTRPFDAPMNVTLYEITDEQINETMGITRDVIRIVGTFPVSLTDYGISVPAPMRAKVAETIQVQVRLTAMLAAE